MARLVALAFGANLLMQTMCRAKATAQQRMRTSPGPNTKLNSLSIEMRARPMIERVMPTIAARAGFWRRKKKEKIGTSYPGFLEKRCLIVMKDLCELLHH